MVRAELTANSDASTVICVLGAGFDLRSFRLKESFDCDWCEIDLPHVISQKQLLFDRLRARRPQLASRIDAIRLISANLTEHAAMEAALVSALAPRQNGHSKQHVIYVIEALLFYMPTESCMSLLSATVDAAAASGATSVSVCFADRLPGMDFASFEEARGVLKQAQLDLVESSWLPKPGIAKHMGCAVWRMST